MTFRPATVLRQNDHNICGVHFRSIIKGIVVFAVFSGSLSSCQEGDSRVNKVKIDERDRNITSYMTVFDVFSCKPSHTAFIAAHRGTEQGSKWPENSLAALKELHKNGVYFAEIDVARLKNGTHILFHDGVWDKRSNQVGAIANTSWEQAQTFLLRDTNGTLTHFTPPRLEDILLWAKNRLYLELDFKSSANIPQIIKLLKKHNMEQHVILIAYSQRQARALHALSPKSMISVSVKTKGDIKAYNVLGLQSGILAAWTGYGKYDQISKSIREKDIPILAASFPHTDKRAISNQNLSVYGSLRKTVDLVVSDRALYASPYFKFTPAQMTEYKTCLKTKAKIKLGKQ